MTLATPSTNPKPASCGPPAGSYVSISNAQASVNAGSLCHLQLRAPGKPPGSGLHLFHCTASATTPRRGSHGLLAILHLKQLLHQGQVLLVFVRLVESTALHHISRNFARGFDLFCFLLLCLPLKTNKTRLLKTFN